MSGVHAKMINQSDKQEKVCGRPQRRNGLPPSLPSCECTVVRELLFHELLGNNLFAFAFQLV